jgi:hypothetical protein
MPDGTVVIMGAGFSRAVASEMPLTDELGNLAQARAGFGAQDWWATGWTFEALLSRLAEDQPDLDEEENLLNRSRFVATAKAISSVLVERQRQAVARPAPQWLLRLVGSLHAQDTTVISFNYDTLIEAAVVAHTMLDWSTGQRVQDSDVVGHLPPNPPGTWGDDVRQTFRLLKLHGSVNWWWSPGDTTAASIHRWRLGDTFGSPGQDDDAERSRLLPGRSRFIVPPTATKSTYYTNPFTRELWRRAAEALTGAREVYLVGYSLPIADLVVAGMLRQWVSRSTPFTIVNPHAAPIEAHLLMLGWEPSEIRRIGGDDCVERFVDEIESSVTHFLHARLTGQEPDDHPICIAWSENTAAAVLGVRRENGVLVLLTEPITMNGEAFGVRDGQDEPVSMAVLLGALSGCTHLVARDPTGNSFALAQLQTVNRSTGYRSTWHALVPTAAPPIS